jgi:uncharacterized coiled-coil protein SlyX
MSGEYNYQRVVESLRRPVESTTADILECYGRSIAAQEKTIGSLRELLASKDQTIAMLREQLDLDRVRQHEHLAQLNDAVKRLKGHASV